MHIQRHVAESDIMVLRDLYKKYHDGTNDLLVSQVIRTNELQVWFLAQHLMAVPRKHADQTGTAQKSAGMRVVATSGRFATES
jgi:starvation-inducible DNA-binding protein